MLVPLTASLYVPGTLDDADRVLVDVGTGYFIEVLRLEEFLVVFYFILFCTDRNWYCYLYDFLLIWLENNGRRWRLLRSENQLAEIQLWWARWGIFLIDNKELLMFGCYMDYDYAFQCVVCVAKSLESLGRMFHWVSQRFLPQIISIFVIQSNSQLDMCTVKLFIPPVILFSPNTTIVFVVKNKQGKKCLLKWMYLEYMYTDPFLKFTAH